MSQLLLTKPPNLTSKQEQKEPQKEVEVNVDGKQVPVSKILNYIKKDDMITVVTPQVYYAIVDAMKKKYNKQKINVREIKKEIAANPDYNKILATLSNSNAGAGAIIKYKAAKAKMKNLDKAKIQYTRKEMPT